jgi:hypothetical protein
VIVDDARPAATRHPSVSELPSSLPPFEEDDDCGFCGLISVVGRGVFGRLFTPRRVLPNV